MDSGTHIVMGIGLSALSTIDPVTTDPTSAEAVFLGVLIGSVIPDIDTVLKLKDNATYIRHHRGITHALPFTILWPVILTGVIHLFYDQANLFHLWLWTFLAVILHVSVDIFNAYGTQALWPITPKWIALGMISIFDPVIFGIHLCGFVLWYVFGHPGLLFSFIYVIIIGYYLLRTWHKRRALAKVRHQLPNAKAIYLSPTIHWNQYHVAAKTPEEFVVGEADRLHFVILDRFKRVPLPNDQAVNAALKDKNIRAFLSFSPIYRFEIKDYNGFTDIRFIDLRYLSKGHYPFVAVARVNPDSVVVSSYTGWIYNNEKLEKKLAVTCSEQ
jgi:inner membrane protein